MCIAFFDLDHTILDTSSGNIMFRGSYESGIIGKRGIAGSLGIILLYRLGLMSAERAVGRWMRWYRGIDVETILPLAAEWIETLKGHVRGDAVREIRRQRELGARTVILSASPTFICERMRDYLKMDDMICTELEIVDGRLTGRLRKGYCHGREKLIRAVRYCDALGRSIKDTWYYADSIADLPVLEAVGNPVCVTPDARLMRIARKRGWRIERWD